MKRPILVALAAAILNIGVVGAAPARAAVPDSSTVAGATPAHHHGHRHHYRDDDGYESHRHHPRDYDGDDDGHRRRCSGLIVICLV